VDPLFAYDANYLIDNKVGIIVDAEGTRANRTVEITITETMIERAKCRSDLRPQRLAGDSVYGAVRRLKWLVDRAACSGVGQVRTTRWHLQPSDFVFDPQRNVYICPGGAELTSTGNIDQGHIVYYRANRNDCSACSLKLKCTTAPMRKVTRDVNEDVRDRVRALANTEAFQQSSRERKKVEMRFAHMKRILRLDRLRLRGLSGAKDEVLLTANRAEPEAACQAPLPCSATISGLPGVSVASRVAAKASIPQLHPGTSRRAKPTGLPARKKRPSFATVSKVKRTRCDGRSWSADNPKPCTVRRSLAAIKPRSHPRAIRCPAWIRSGPL
jgi:hypothetical protein